MTQILLRLLLIYASLSLAPILGRPPAPRRIAHLPSALDQRVGSTATVFAGRSPLRALRWLRAERAVREAGMAADGKTVAIRFRDGARLVILPRSDRPPGGVGRALPASESHYRALAAGASQRAIILEPFGKDLGTGEEQAEVSALTQAGFSVDVVRNGDVTVKTMESLSSYSLVYMESHSSTQFLGGDAVVVTDQLAKPPYPSGWFDGSVMQATVAGQPNVVYFGVTGAFFAQHMDLFPTSSILFLNGCSLLEAPVFWQELHSRNVGAMISWDGYALSTVTAPAAKFLIDRLASGRTVAGSIADAQAAGLATSVLGADVTHLGFLGDGEDTLAKALVGATATPEATATSQPTATAAPPTGTPTATAAPTVNAASAPPTATAVPTAKATKKVKCKRGYHVVHGKCRPKPKRCKKKHCP